jgi:DNA-directed RNA polymerase specialized sigma24 family protein
LRSCGKGSRTSEKLAKYNHLENSPDDFMENDGFAALFNTNPSMEQEVERAVAQLGDEQQTCVRLFFYDDKSYREIATETGYTEKQVKSYLQNGKRNLRILLEKELRKHTTFKFPDNYNCSNGRKFTTTVFSGPPHASATRN